MLRHLAHRPPARAHLPHRCLLVLLLVPVALPVEPPVAVSPAVVHLLVVVAELRLVAADPAVAVELVPPVVVAVSPVALAAAVAVVAVVDHVAETRAAQLLVHSVVPVVVPRRVASPRSSGVKSLMICRLHRLVA